MEKLQCEIERVTYANEDNGYTVIKCSVDGHEDLVPVVGYMPEPTVGTVYNFYGNWKRHPKYGIQFNFEKFEECLPTTIHGIQKYLSSGKIKGIGETYAARIIQKFGEKAIDILDDDPDKLLEVPGIGAKRLEMIKESWESNREINKSILRNERTIIQKCKSKCNR